MIHVFHKILDFDNDFTLYKVYLKNSHCMYRIIKYIKTLQFHYNIATANN